MKAFVFVCLVLPCFALAQTKKAGSKTVAKSTGDLLQSSITRGQVVYQAYCLSCHQRDGSGVPNMNPPLTQTKWVLGLKNVLIKQILKGSKGTVEIDGDTFHNTMPAQPFLTDQQIADVLTFVRNNFGNKASMVTPAEVKATRAKLK